MLRYYVTNTVCYLSWVEGNVALAIGYIVTPTVEFVSVCPLEKHPWMSSTYSAILQPFPRPFWHNQISSIEYCFLSFSLYLCTNVLMLRFVLSIPDLLGPNAGGAGNAIGLQIIGGPKVTILASKTSRKYFDQELRETIEPFLRYALAS